MSNGNIENPGMNLGERTRARDELAEQETQIRLAMRNIPKKKDRLPFEEQLDENERWGLEINRIAIKERDNDPGMKALIDKISASNKDLSKEVGRLKAAADKANQVEQVIAKGDKVLKLVGTLISFVA